MSTHRNDFLVSSHQAKLHREAAEARLARAARERTPAGPATGSPGVVGRLVLGLDLALRRRSAVHIPHVTAPTVSPTVRS